MLSILPFFGLVEGAVYILSPHEHFQVDEPPRVSKSGEDEIMPSQYLVSLRLVPYLGYI
jgi:hypothetical protein